MTFLSVEVVSKEKEGVSYQGQRRELKMEKSSQQKDGPVHLAAGNRTRLGKFRRLNEKK